MGVNKISRALGFFAGRSQFLQTTPLETYGLQHWHVVIQCIKLHLHFAHFVNLHYCNVKRLISLSQPFDRLWFPHPIQPINNFSENRGPCKYCTQLSECQCPRKGSNMKFLGMTSGCSCTFHFMLFQKSLDEM